MGPDCKAYKGYLVNSKKSGLYREILESIVGQLEACYAIHRRLLVVRFDLHSYGFEITDGNKQVSSFLKCIIQWIGRNYATKKTGRIWVREREKAKQQHYHCALLIDGDKIRHPKLLLEAISTKWENYHPDNCPCVWDSRWGKSYHLADKDSGLADAVKRLSYLAKARGKGYRPEQAKDYGTSRIKLPKA